MALASPAKDRPEQIPADLPSATTRGSTARLEPLLLCAIAALESLAIWTLLATAGNTVIHLAAVHVASLTAIALLLALNWRQGRDTTLSLLALIGCAAIGPIGPLGAGVLGLAALKPRQSSPLIAEWYERISLSTAVDPETRLCEDVSVGRTLDLGAPKPQPFPTIMEQGPLGARQFILGLIARQFHPVYLETLKIALKSPEPSIRVQAAAVATHIGADLRQRFQEIATSAERHATDPITTLDHLGQIETFMASGLLDAAERQRAITLAAQLGDRVVEALAPGPLPLPYATDPCRAAELESALENLLLSRRHFAELRTHRTARRVQRFHPTARLRRLVAQQPAREVTP